MHYIDAISWYYSICVFLSQNVRVFFLFFSFFTLLLLFSWLRFLRTNTITTDNNTNRWQSKKKQLTALFFSSKLFCLLSFCWLNPKKKNISTNDLRVQHIAQCVCVPEQVEVYSTPMMTRFAFGVDSRQLNALHPISISQAILHFFLSITKSVIMHHIFYSMLSFMCVLWVLAGLIAKDKSKCARELVALRELSAPWQTVCGLHIVLKSHTRCERLNAF